MLSSWKGWFGKSTQKICFSSNSEIDLDKEINDHEACLDRPDKLPKETKYQMTSTSPDKMPTNHLAFCDCLLAFCPTTDGSWWGIFRLDLAKPARMILANFGEEVGWDKSQPVCSALPPSAPPSICCVQPWPGQDTLSPGVINGQGCCGKETIIQPARWER